MAAVVSSLRAIIRMIHRVLFQLDDPLKVKATISMELIHEYFSDFQTERTSGNA
jgi:hypothetical protein